MNEHDRINAAMYTEHLLEAILEQVISDCSDCVGDCSECQAVRTISGIVERSKAEINTWMMREHGITSREMTRVCSTDQRRLQ